jgi:hypothetical protein
MFVFRVELSALQGGSPDTAGTFSGFLSVIEKK